MDRRSSPPVVHRRFAAPIEAVRSTSRLRAIATRIAGAKRPPRGPTETSPKSRPLGTASATKAASTCAPTSKRPRGAAGEETAGSVPAPRAEGGAGSAGLSAGRGASPGGVTAGGDVGCPRPASGPAPACSGATGATGATGGPATGGAAIGAVDARGSTASAPISASAEVTSLQVLPDTDRAVLDAVASSIHRRPAYCSPLRSTTTCITRARSFGCAARAFVVRAEISRKNATDVGQPSGASYATASGSGASCARVAPAIVRIAAQAPMPSLRDMPTV